MYNKKKPWETAVAQKRTKNQKIRGIQATLEKHRRFDFQYIPLLGKWVMPDKNFAYRQRGFDRVLTGFWRTFLKLFTRPLFWIAYGGIWVDGKKNLKAIGKSGAICVCNHFNYLDTLFVRTAAGHYRTFHTMGPWNNKTGLGGHIIRHGGMWPFSKDREATRNLLAEMERQLKNGKIVNFYAEQVMWTNYQKPRPMKDGAFHYAVKFSVPVLPIFCTFKRNKRGHLRCVHIHILPAVYGDGTLPKGGRIEAMKACAESEWKDCYEKAYGIPLKYEN